MAAKVAKMAHRHIVAKGSNVEAHTPNQPMWEMSLERSFLLEKRNKNLKVEPGRKSQSPG
jgi:hypothetical protein